MKLDGGINEYFSIHERHKEKLAPKGRKVKFLNKNGRDTERQEANKRFTQGQVLTVKEIYVGSSSSTVEFMELPKELFNTVMFEDIPS